MVDETCGKMLTIVGTILIKIGTGISTTWGVVSIYILSYFYEEGMKIGKNTNSYIVLGLSVPTCFFFFAAPKLA